MAVVNTKSTIVTNADATPPALTGSYINGGRVLEQVGYVEVAAADDDGSVYRFCRLPANARITEILLMHDAITGGTDYDLGVYETLEDGSAVVDVNAFGDALDLSTARNVPTVINALPVEESREQQIWEAAGVSADPAGKEYDICLTGVTVGTGAGTICMIVRYVM